MSVAYPRHSSDWQAPALASGSHHRSLVHADSVRHQADSAGQQGSLRVTVVMCRDLLRRSMPSLITCQRSARRCSSPPPRPSRYAVHCFPESHRLADTSLRHGWPSYHLQWLHHQGVRPDTLCKILDHFSLQLAFPL